MNLELFVNGFVDIAHLDSTGCLLFFILFLSWSADTLLLFNVQPFCYDRKQFLF